MKHAPTHGFAARVVTRLGIGITWASVGRIVVWTAAWVLVIGWVVRPAAPVPADRDLVADVPPSPVRYLGPTSPGDFAGFLAPEPGDTDDVFTVAMIGGSEVKLREVSVAGEVANRITTVGGMPTRFDAYTVVAPRPIDALRAMEAAIANGSDAITLSINPVWVRDETSMREWANLDVANFGTLWSDPGSWLWALALESPADAAWRLSRAVSPLVEAQQRLSRRASGWTDRVDVLERPTDDGTATPVPASDVVPQLAGDATSFWLVDAYGDGVLDDTTERVARMVEGFAGGSPAARHFARRLVETAESAGVPVFLYVAPFSPESATNPRFAAAQATIEAFWTDVATTVTSPLVTVEPRSMTPEFADRAGYFDVVHMYDAAPFAEVLRGRLCDQWRTADPDLECGA